MRKRTADCLFVRHVLVLDCKQNQTKKLQFIQLLVVTEEKNVKEKTRMDHFVVTEEKNVKEKSRMDRFRGDRGTGDLIVGEDLIESSHIRSEGEAWR